MKKSLKKFSVDKYIKKLINIKAPHFTIGQDHSLGLRPFKHPDGIINYKNFTI